MKYPRMTKAAEEAFEYACFQREACAGLVIALVADDWRMWVGVAWLVALLILELTPDEWLDDEDRP